MIEQDLEFIKSHSSVFLACSGGMDSIALAHDLWRHRIKFSMAHCNFKLRGEDSEGDETFVRQFCSEREIPFYSQSFDTILEAKEHGNSIEIEARNLRYRFFEELTAEYDIDLFLTAHHREDMSETILMRIIAGTGLKGLKGIPKFRKPNYYRPYLDIPKSEIEQYVFLHKIEYRTDASNFENIYTRNKLRNIIIPALKEINPSVSAHIAQLSAIASQADDILEERCAPFRALWDKNYRVDLSSVAEKSYLPLILYSLLEPYKPNKSHIDILSQHLGSPESKRVSIDLVTFEVKNGILEKINSISEENKTVYEWSDLYENERFEYEILENIPTKYEKNTNYIDLDKLLFPIQIMTPKAGQIIRPIGMFGNSKKISDILKQNKFSVNQKQNALVILDATGEIVSLLGVCTAESVKVTIHTARILKIKWKLPQGIL